MNILILHGSPRPLARSNTYAVTKAFLKGLGDGHSVEVIDVMRRDVRPCLGCFGCWHESPGRCVQRDDMDDILPKFIQADLVIWSLPLYYFGMPSHSKALMDRMLPLVEGDITVGGADGRGTHPLRYDLHYQTILISTAGFPGAHNNFDALQTQFETIYGDSLVGCILIPEGELLLLPDAAPFTAPLFAKAVAAGGEFAKTGALTSATLSAFHEPMIPIEAYAAGAGQ